MGCMELNRACKASLQGKHKENKNSMLTGCSRLSTTPLFSATFMRQSREEVLEVCGVRERFREPDDDTDAPSRHEASPSSEAMPEIDWGVFEQYFKVYNLQMERVTVRDGVVAGRIGSFDALTFNVEAKTNFRSPFGVRFKVQFYDSEGIQIGGETFVRFAPGYKHWRQGMRSRVIIELRARGRMSNVSVIKVRELGSRQ